MKFNMNNYIKVQLTDLGREIHKNRWYDSQGSDYLRAKYPYRAPDEDADGWSKWQMWDFMNVYGPHFGNGMNIPASTEIIICDPAA